MRALTLLLIIPLFISCGDDKAPGPKTFATADIYLVSSSDGETFEQGTWIGNAAFIYQDGVTSLKVSLAGLEPNSQHAMHLHQGTLENPGRHWNQNRLDRGFCNIRSLGEVWAKTFAGDIGNIDIDGEGNGTFALKTDLWALGTDDEKDVAGTVLFVHENFEDFANECDPGHGHQHGHTNAKIAGGTVVLDAQLLQ
ncbi:MAG: superoxide dismutase family protein [Ekhidna sp.]